MASVLQFPTLPDLADLARQPGVRRLPPVPPVAVATAQLEPADDNALRDWFAGLALNAILIGPDWHESRKVNYHSQAEVVAGWAYAYADAMLKARTAGRSRH